MSALPAREEMFVQAVAALNDAYRRLGDAADWLRSDWEPVGSPLTDAQANARSRMFNQIGRAKAAVNLAKDAADRAVPR